MLYNVPQYTDVEDKIAGPLTGKQLLWLFGMGAVLLVLWSILQRGVFFVLAFPVVVLFATFAFYKPQGEPLIKYVSHGIFFLFRPKIYTWKRPSQSQQHIQKATKERIGASDTKKSISLEEIRMLSQTLDSEGMSSVR